MPYVAMIGTVVLALSLGTPQDPMNARGAQAMGFDQDKATHHFLLYEDGGAIDIAVKDAADVENRDAIRAHLPHIAQMFGQGNFDLPHFIHATDVPGTDDDDIFSRQDSMDIHHFLGQSGRENAGRSCPGSREHLPGSFSAPGGQDHMRS